MKLNKEDKDLIEKAKEIILKSKAVDLIDTGEVGCALITSKGNFFQGVSVGFSCGIGTCAEYQAVGNMVSNGEKVIISANKKVKLKELLPYAWGWTMEK